MFFKKIKFQKKFFLFYSLLALTIIIILTTAFYFYIYSYIKSDSQSYFVQVVDKVSSNIDNFIFSLDVVSTQLIASKDLQRIFLKAGASPSDTSNYFDLNLNDRQMAQSIFLSINSPKDRVKKISIYSSPNSFVSIGDILADYGPDERNLNYKKWTEYFTDPQIFFKILPPFSTKLDNGNDNNITISLIRPFIATYSSYNPLGIIELQQDYSKIENICRLEGNKKGLELFIIDDESNLIYPYQKNSLTEASMYFDSLKRAKPGVIYSLKNKISDQNELVCYSNIKSYSWHVILAQPENLFMEPVYNVLRLLFLLCFLFMVITVIIIFITTRSLTRPIRELRESVKSISFENPNINISPTHNEIELLKDTFNEMLNQLKESANKIIQSRASELQAHFLALQAQINPHFLYNSIMSISAAGQEAGSEKVQIMCSQLGEIFRYIASTENSTTTIQDEMNHAEIYLRFIKWRYEDRFDFSIGIVNEMYGLMIPKLVVQPIIENCFSHGFFKVRPPLKISIKGSYNKDIWTIEISDNGNGFSEDALEKIKIQMDKIDDNILNGKVTNDLKVGGMALINIYTRLKLLYGDTVVFKIENCPDGGSKVIIGGTVIK